ncbi:GNAT family N-acetyltransferase [Nocardioides limicola]|uniref:GNAT family N-acetyltransferase n=1 Tax=Nocardioides limicola TaxID=2803368 RepID=UPI00193C6007|nr:GNAT family N-acetyltransferase [Nocardioides sp. DJM-14]
MPEVTYREATLAEAEAGARLHLTCWREGYAPYVDPGLLEARLADPLPWIEGWRRSIEHGTGRLLAFADREPIGFIAVGRPRDIDTEHELYALYVRRAWWGTGVGQELLERRLFPGSCALWVLESNARARAFYARNGFVAQGDREFYDLLDVWQVRMVRPD